jgi:hypothetical protein
LRLNSPTFKLHWLAAANDRPRELNQRARQLAGIRNLRHGHAPHPLANYAASTDQAKDAATPRITHMFTAPDRPPDPENGELLMVDTLGVADREATHGILGNW